MIAERVARVQASKFGSDLYPELLAEAHKVIVENPDKSNGYLWKTMYWRLFDYAVSLNKSRFESMSDALEYIGYQPYLPTEEDKVNLYYDISVDLSKDAQDLLTRLFANEVECELPITMRQIRLSLMRDGWTERKARGVVNEIKDWWRDYVYQ